MSEPTNLALNEAYTMYVDEQKGHKQQEGYQDLSRFVHWCGKSSPVLTLTPQTVASYAEWVALGGEDAPRKLEPVKAFLTFLKRKSYTDLSLAPHVRIPKGKNRVRNSVYKGRAEQAILTKDGYRKLTARLETLKEQRVKVRVDIGRAMADKDFRENAPLDAAKERQGLIESMIRDLEATLGSATIASESSTEEILSVALGRKVLLKNASTGRQVSYTLVHPKETNPAEGKISSESPVGKALLNKHLGEEVEISIPSGKIRYFIEKVDH